MASYNLDGGGGGSTTDTDDEEEDLTTEDSTADTGGTSGTSRDTSFTSGTGTSSSDTDFTFDSTDDTADGAADDDVTTASGGETTTTTEDTDEEAVRDRIVEQTDLEAGEVEGARRVTDLSQQPTPAAVGDFASRPARFAPILTDEAFERRARRRFFAGTDFDTDPSEFLPQDVTAEDVPQLQIGALRQRFGDDAFEFDRERTASSTVARVSIDEDVQREALRERVADRNEGIDPDDVVVEETDSGFRARPERGALEDALRERVAGEHGGVDPEDVEIAEEGGALQARVETEQTGRPRGAEPQTREQEFLDKATFGLTRKIREKDDPEILQTDVEAPSLEIETDRSAVLDPDESAVNVTARNFPDVDPEDATKAGGVAGAAGLAVAAPEPVSTGVGLGVLGGVAAAGVVANQQGELGVGDPAGGSELDVGRPRQEVTELEASSGTFASELGVGEVTASELEPSRPRSETSELDVGEGPDGRSFVPGEFPTAGTAPVLEQPGQRSITREEEKTDIQRLIEEGDDVFEGRRDPRGAFRPERDYPTGESAVIGREVTQEQQGRVEEAEQLDVLQEDDALLDTGVQSATSTRTAPAALTDTATDLDVGVGTSQDVLTEQAMLQDTALGQGQGVGQGQGLGEGVGTGQGVGQGQGFGQGFGTGSGVPTSRTIGLDLPDLDGELGGDRRRRRGETWVRHFEFGVASPEDVLEGTDIEGGELGGLDEDTLF